MALILQLATLLLATTAFAAPSPTCTPLQPETDPNFKHYTQIATSLGAGFQTYTCNTDAGVYESASFNLRLYDACCLNTTSYFNQIEAVVQVYLTDNPDASSTELDLYINQHFDLTSSGQLTSIGDNIIEINIQDNDAGNSDTVDVKVLSQSDDEWTLIDTNGGDIKVLLVERNSPRPTSACGTGSPDITEGVASLIYIYRTAPNF